MREINYALWAIAVALVLLALAITWAAPRYQLTQGGSFRVVVRLDVRTGELELFGWKGNRYEGPFEKMGRKTR